MGKKILIATDAWFPQVNGVVRCVDEIVKALRKRGYEVTVIHPDLFRTLPLFFYPEIHLALFPKKKIEKMIKEINPDYIHIVTESFVGLAARAVCVKNKYRFTTSYHTHYQYYIERYTGLKLKFLFNLADRYMRWFHNASAKTMVITENFKAELAPRGFLHLVLWPLGVDTDLFKRNEHSTVKKGLNLASPVFVYFGRMAQEKNVEEFLKLDLPGTKLVVGDGPLKAPLEKKYGAKAIFVGYKKGQELVDFLSACDVFVFPSLTDTFPLAIIEAFACGLPVAAHNVMDLKNLVKGGVGVLGADLASAAVKCLEIPREKCREYALGFSWEKSADYFEKNLINKNA